MRLKEFLGKNSETALAAVSIQSLHLMEDKEKQADEMVRILNTTKPREIVKGLTLITNILSCAITQLDTPLPLYEDIRKSLERTPNPLTKKTENDVLNLLEAAEEPTSARYHLLLNLCQDPIALVGSLLVLNRTLLNNSIWDGTPKDILLWLSEIFVEDDILGA